MTALFALLTGITALIFAMVPVNSLNSKPEDEGFELVCQTKIESADVPILKYVSKKTGLHVIIAKVDGPSVAGYFTLATEASDNDGLPHTLEHLVFLGSEDFPYKGVLDLLANRCIADGTNAWTDVDHTAYTVKTAGSAGFINLLPIYLDHLLYPTLTDAGFITEVYHVTGEGEDAGVVYSEMQARENTGPELAYNTLIKMLYPAPSGYRFETGGKMENFRDSITHKKIVDYHKAMYRPENLHVIIVGQVEPHEIFKAIKPIEEKILAKGDRGPYTRPWESPVPAFNQSQEEEFVYASDDESNGIVMVGWRGPSVITNITETQSLDILMEYLTDLSVSPLPKVFVEVEEPLASEVKKSLLQNSETSLLLTFSGVPRNKINEVKPLLQKTLEAIANEEEPFSMEVMKNILRNEILQEENLMETQPHNNVASNLISDLLFGHNCEDLNKFVNKKSWLEHLLTQPSSYWIHLLKKYLTTPPSAVSKGIPAKNESKRIQKEVEDRVKERVETLKEQGLKKLADKLEQAKITNEIEPPKSMLETVPVPSVDKINYHSLSAYSNLKSIEPKEVPSGKTNLIDLTKFPVKMQVDNVKSNFVEIDAILDTSSLDAKQRTYIELLMDLVLESPIKTDANETIPYEEVVKNLNADTISAKTVNGLSGHNTYFLFSSYVNYICVNLKVEMPKYAKGVDWLKKILNNVVLDRERVKVKANKLLNSIGEHKRSGTKMLTLMFNHVLYKPNASPNRINALRQEKFLTQILADLETKPEEVLDQLKQVYDEVTEPNRVVIHMGTNLEKLSQLTDVAKPWIDFAPTNRKNSTLNFTFTPVADHELTNDLSADNSTTGYVAGIGSVESAFIYQTATGIKDYCHEDLPPLMTAISYLTQLEGPMWREVRGKGLAYGYGITLKAQEGTITLKLIRAAQVVGAYEEAHKIINRYLNGSDTWDEILFESAKSTLLYEVIDRESEVSEVVRQSLLAYFRKVPHDYNRAMLKKISKVTIEEMDRAARKYLTPMIDPKRSKTIIVCPSNKAEEVKLELEKSGHSMELIPSLSDSQFADL